MDRDELLAPHLSTHLHTLIKDRKSIAFKPLSTANINFINLDFNQSVANQGMSIQHLSNDVSTGDIPEEDLVNRLIRDNQDLWNQLLNNDFVQVMRIASADNQPVLNGFKWYMIQDFFYCLQVVAYNADRAAKAPNPKVYADLTKALNSTLSHVAPSILKVCTDADKLNIPDTVVFAAEREEATEKYSKFMEDVAEDENWVVSLLAQVPGYQSYFTISHDLQESALDKDTAWYKLWVIDNAKHQKSTVNQVEFFKANYESWKDIPYEKLTKIFRQGCQCEIDLWAVALKPGPLK